MCISVLIKDAVGEETARLFLLVIKAVNGNIDDWNENEVQLLHNLES